jgi:D-glycero-D-manno-heptose 1,7-bisphosphate phosphatase
MHDDPGWFPSWLVLDRDGTLIRDEHYLAQVAQVQLLPQTLKGLRCFQEKGCRFVVVTNQSGVGRGYFDVQQVDAVHAHLHCVFQSEGIDVCDYFYCPHKPSDRCSCRKPEVALYEEAAARHQIVAGDCLVVGDKASDIEMGQRVSAKTALVMTGHGRQTLSGMNCIPDYVANDLYDLYILLAGGQDRRKGRT